MDTLDLRNLEGLIDALKTARSAGFFSESSPVDVLLEIIIDSILSLKNALKEGAKERTFNPELRFLENFRDELGNTKSIRIKKTPRVRYDPESERFLNQIISFFVLLKTDKRSVAQVFMTCFAPFFKSSFSEPPKDEHIRRIQEKKRRPESRKRQVQYFRRLRLKRNNPKKHRKGD